MGQPVKWYTKYSFLIEVEGVVSAAFTTCSEIRGNAETVEYREGGRLHPHKSPGLMSFPPITLTRGRCEDYDLYNYFKDTFDAAAGTGLTTPDIYRTIDIVQLDRDGEEVERHTLYGAWCKEYQSSNGWDNNANEILMEEIVIEYDHFERTPS